MTTFDRSSKYYSGQGVVMLGDRSATGKGINFRPLGNVTALTISTETSTLEHKESQSGQRAVDFRLTTETNVTCSLTLENFARDVLALAMRGGYTDVAAGSVTGEAIAGYPGSVAPLQKVKVSAVAVKRGATSLTLYSNDATPYDYKLNSEAGSIQINDGSTTPVAAITTGGTAPSAITVGATTSVTVANTAAVGDYMVITGLSGTDAAFLNGKWFRILTASPTAVTLDVNTTGKTITLGTPLSAFSGVALTVDYSYAAQVRVDALTTAAPEKFLRFEGLNTLDGNNPVVVEVFKFVLDPASEFGLITGEEAASLAIEGSVLADPLQSSGSQFYREMALS